MELKDLQKLLTMKRNMRRKLLLLCWLVVFLAIVVLAEWMHRGGPPQEGWMIILLTMVIFSGILRGVRVQRAYSEEVSSLFKEVQPARRRMDERELSVSEKMHARALNYLSLFAVPVMLFLTALECGEFPELIFLRVPVLWLFWFMISSLPQSLILWNEPDAGVEP